MDLEETDFCLEERIGKLFLEELMFGIKLILGEHRFC
jgi:hypothetical protein